ncbi:Crp/Fnr family transcriptional regulator [Plectonema cf. radiosum LEGE 06105]|uniref:Crp/Fnr family transcriptional regulator n=1 Tax=Plectonema cf. radiosum LEGE 06105 TaxID=945769 RepID=A0A8J7FGF8_9CYAN|nr:Crp/Fnr family transcriptional regulator [Plectonema radiosum]MBE9213476.1 Crp/Fnr family transcriptional regulator [Plectonema cf. radiosum LEGE 06105]
MSSFKIKDLPKNLLAAMTHHNLADGEILFYQNEVANAVFVVDYGCIKLIHYIDDGTTVNHYAVKPGEYFAEVALFNETYVCSAIAKNLTRVISFPKQLFLDALHSDANLSRKFTEQLARRLHQTKLLLELRGIRSARDRFLHYLQVMIPPDQTTLDLEQPLKDVASDIGITPEALSRVLSQLQNEGILTRFKRKIIFRY